MPAFPRSSTMCMLGTGRNELWPLHLHCFPQKIPVENIHESHTEKEEGNDCPDLTDAQILTDRRSTR